MTNARVAAGRSGEIVVVRYAVKSRRAYRFPAGTSPCSAAAASTTASLREELKTAMTFLTSTTCRVHSGGTVAKENAPDGLEGVPVVPILMQLVSLDVVVQVELVGMRAHPDRVRFDLSLVIDPHSDEIFGEDAALGEELVILLEFAESLFE
jgi:hypothetical protein